MITPQVFKAYMTGIAAIDFEHWHLLKQMDRAYLADSFEDAQSRVDEFINAWALHHDHEERLMRDIRFPGVNAHIEGHSRLHEIYARLRNDALNGSHTLSSAKAYIAMVEQLIRNHIKLGDFQYAEWAKLNLKPDELDRLGVGRQLNF
jgi:hemerythrin-like metal-binding protein